MTPIFHLLHFCALLKTMATSNLRVKHNDSQLLISRLLFSISLYIANFHSCLLLSVWWSPLFIWAKMTRDESFLDKLPSRNRIIGRGVTMVQSSVDLFIFPWFRPYIRCVAARDRFLYIRPITLLRFSYCRFVRLDFAPYIYIYSVSLVLYILYRTHLYVHSRVYMHISKHRCLSPYHFVTTVAEFSLFSKFSRFWLLKYIHTIVLYIYNKAYIWFGTAARML